MARAVGTLTPEVLEQVELDGEEVRHVEKEDESQHHAAADVNLAGDDAALAEVVGRVPEGREKQAVAVGALPP